MTHLSLRAHDRLLVVNPGLACNSRAIDDVTMSCKAWGVPIGYALNKILNLYSSPNEQIARCFVLRSLAAASGILLLLRVRLKHDRSSSAGVSMIISNAHQHSVVSACAA